MIPKDQTTSAPSASLDCHTAALAATMHGDSFGHWIVCYPLDCMEVDPGAAHPRCGPTCYGPLRPASSMMPTSMASLPTWPKRLIFFQEPSSWRHLLGWGHLLPCSGLGRVPCHRWHVDLSSGDRWVNPSPPILDLRRAVLWAVQRCLLLTACCTIGSKPVTHWHKCSPTLMIGRWWCQMLPKLSKSLTPWCISLVC